MCGYIKRKASDLKLRPAKFSGHQEKGIVSFIDRESIAAGAQCGTCHTVVWLDFTKNPVLNQRPPNSVPEFGTEVKQYLFEQWSVVMSVLPSCPECGSDNFDQPVTDYSYQRWPNGDEFNLSEINSKQINLDASEISAWWLKDELQNSIFDRAWIHHVERNNNAKVEEE